jgi:ubiquinone/menaquinone biosynthesis C-methylase UbiE
LSETTRADEGQDLARVAELWGRTAAARVETPLRGWLDSPIVLSEYVQPKQTGSATKNWLVGLVERLGIPRTGRWLSLGCGSAGTEIFASEAGLFSSLHALDASEQALVEARRAAAARGVENLSFARTDLNHVSLPSSTFDVAMMCMSLHHVKNLGGTLSAVRRALKPGGFLFLNEFVGPRQFQFTDLQLGIVRELLALLPERLRIDCTTGLPKTEYVRMPVEHWNVADPSEAIRSDEIVEQVGRLFETILRADYGGTILGLLLEHIVHNFRAEDEGDVSTIRLLARTEDLLIRHGVLASDYTLIAARKRPGWSHRVRSVLTRRDPAG